MAKVASSAVEQSYEENLIVFNRRHETKTRAEKAATDEAGVEKLHGPIGMHPYSEAEPE